MSLQEKIENLETDLHLMGRLVLDALVDGVRALEDKDAVSYTHLTLPTICSV